MEFNILSVVDAMNPQLFVFHFLRQWISLCRVVLIVLFIAPSISGAVTEKKIKLAGDASVLLRIHPASGNRLLLWLPSEYGLVDETYALASRLAMAGIEAWQADLFAAHFLPPLPSSINKIPVADIATVIDYATRRKGKNVYVFADGRGALLVLRGVKKWQQSYETVNSGNVKGAVLLSPSLYVEMPQPGQQAQYLPIVGQSVLNTVILQPKMSPWYWWRDRLQAKLRQHGSGCEMRVLEGVRDRFYFRPDATSAEMTLLERLPLLIRESITRLEHMQEARR